MHLNKSAMFLLSVCNAYANSSILVKSLIFDNYNNSVSIEFSEPIIIENLFLMKKTEEEDICVPVQSLNDDILVPMNYNENLQKYKEYKKYYENIILSTDYDENSKKAIADKKKFKEYEARVKVTRVDVILTPTVFDQKVIYLFNVKELEEEQTVYTEEFVYNESGFEHKCSSDSNRWYASPWPWIAIGFIILSALLILKIAFC